jgi:hypothetical protein
MAKVAGFIIGAALIVAGILTDNVALIIQGSAMIVMQGVVDLTMPKTPARQASEMTIQLGEQPRSAFFGEGYTPGSLVDGFDYGGKYGTDWEVLAIRLADHRCAGLTGFYVDDLYIPYVGDGPYTEVDPTADSPHLEVYFRADTTNDALPAVVTTHGPGWTANDIGQSGCDVIVAYRADKPTEKKLAFPGGRPRFGFIVKGALCYDPRLDSTVAGGSGPHRWEDPSTREWSDNPAVCRYNWVRGFFANDAVDDPTALLIGRGLTAAEAPPENVAAPANLCDELVSGEKRFRIAGPVYANQDFIDVEEMFAAATAGSVVTREGSVELEPGQAKSVVATFTDKDILSASKVSWNEAILSESNAEWVNTVVARYVEPSQKWNDHAAPVVRNTLDIIADGRPREASLALRLVRYVAQALRCAEVTRRLGREWGRATVTLGPRFCEIEDGDWVAWQSDRRFGGATRTFRVDAYSIDEKWQNTLTLREISASVYDEGAFDPDHSDVTPTTPPPDIGEPAGANWSLAAVTLSNGGVSVPALEVTGSTSDDDTAEQVIIEYWKYDGVTNPVTDPDDPAWIMEGAHPPTTTKVDITSIQGGQVYYVAVTYVVSGIYGDRLVLGPATAASVDVTGAVDGANSSPATASEAIAVGNFVNIFSSSGAKVRKANATDDTKPVNGYAAAAIANTAVGSIRAPGGKISGLTGLTPGATYYLDAAVAGGITVTPPSGAGNLVQEVGVAISATELFFNPRQGETLS